LGAPDLGALLAWALFLATVAWLASAGRVAAAGVGPVPQAALAVSGLPLPGLTALTGLALLPVALAGLVAVLAASGWRPPAWAFLPLVLVLYAGVSMRMQT
jgi:hypothetical protein